MATAGSGPDENELTIDPTKPDLYARIVAAADKLRKRRQAMNSLRQLERRMAQDRAIAALRAKEELQAKAEAEKKRQATLDALAAEGKPIGAISRPLWRNRAEETARGAASQPVVAAFTSFGD